MLVIPRVLDRLGRHGLVDRVRCESDGRGQLAVLTDAGSARLETAYLTQLSGVRRHVMDHLADLDLHSFTDSLANVAEGVIGPPVRRGRAR